jgi:hypothetical protein
MRTFIGLLIAFTVLVAVGSLVDVQAGGPPSSILGWILGFLLDLLDQLALMLPTFLAPIIEAIRDVLTSIFNGEV